MYRKDVVVDGGKIRKRDKGPSQERYAKKWGHTPLTAAEEIPWGGKRLIIGTGAHGDLPIWRTCDRRVCLAPRPRFPV
jgi:hypothetical protein